MGGKEVVKEALWGKAEKHTPAQHVWKCNSSVWLWQRADRVKRAGKGVEREGTKRQGKELARINLQETLYALCSRDYWCPYNGHSPFSYPNWASSFLAGHRTSQTQDWLSFPNSPAARTCSHVLANGLRVKMTATSFWVIPLKGRAHLPLHHLLFHAGLDMLVQHLGPCR